MTQTTPKPKKSRVKVPKPRVLSQDEARQMFDEEARKWLGMSGDEFVRAWEAGEFDDNPDRPEVMTVALLLPMYTGGKA